MSFKLAHSYIVPNDLFQTNKSLFEENLRSSVQKNCRLLGLDSKKTPFVHLTLDSPRFLARVFAALQIPRRVFAKEIETLLASVNTSVLSPLDTAH